MRTLNGLALALGLGLVGAAVWVGLAFAIDLRLWVILACAVGGLVGYGMGLGTKAAGGIGHGLLAALVCLVVCIGAKGVIAHHHAANFLAQNASVTDEDAYDYLCYTTFVDWVESDLIDMRSIADGDYPPAIHESATQQWEAMTTRERNDLKSAIAEEWSVQLSEGGTLGVASFIAFLLSWGLLDILCVGSAIATSFKIGSLTRPQTEDSVPLWATGAAPAAGTPALAQATPSSPLAPAPSAPSRPSLAPQTRPAPDAAVGAPQDAASSFWNKLGSDAPARSTPSLKRAPKPTAAPTIPPSPGGASDAQPPSAQAA